MQMITIDDRFQMIADGLCEGEDRKGLAKELAESAVNASLSAQENTVRSSCPEVTLAKCLRTQPSGRI